MTQLGLQVSHRVTAILGIHGCVVEVGAYRIHFGERYKVKGRSKVGGIVSNGRELLCHAEREAFAQPQSTNVEDFAGACRDLWNHRVGIGGCGNICSMCLRNRWRDDDDGVCQFWMAWSCSGIAKFLQPSLRSSATRTIFTTPGNTTCNSMDYRVQLKQSLYMGCACLQHTSLGRGWGSLASRGNLS